ncbi:MAG TPA: zinc-dependent metalloprotease [Actinocrinis sp.]|uniref:zinc-dependent metalloprotease n=1 Tax=Actinocrinis sp. TaxID=1920516 RepID=UPI002DDCF526|nr:zinc-dependent metalloprotease [Actinocrinis sp.]HEV2344713.1 zinc-dependent metalloprotease [Actinocrinis sp.]
MPFEDIVKGLEGLGADVEREAKAAEQQAARERAERGGEPRSDAGGDAPGSADNPLAGLLGALGLGGRGGGDIGESLAGLAAGLGQQMPGLDPQMFMMMMGRIQSLINAGDGPVNWAMARDVARTVTAAQPDPSPTSGDLAPIEDAVRLAELWLDEATALPAGTTGALAWSRAEWIEQTLPVWKQLVEPVADRMTGAMVGLLPQEASAGIGMPITGLVRQMGGSLFGHQVGTALAQLATEVLGSSDIGLPLGPDGKAVLLPTNVAAFSAGLDLPTADVRLYLAMRETAYHRLFAHVPWLKAHVLGAVEAYARGIAVDEGRIEELMRNAQSPEGLANLQNVFEEGIVFTAPDTPQQRAALARLETILALTEGWVDAVVHAAASPNLPSAAALRETLRRRRATGGPAEQTFSALVGLEMRPRRLRDAARLWALLGDARGIDGRDDLWTHPDLLPTAEDLDDPDGFVYRDEIDLSGLGDVLGGKGDKKDSRDENSEGGREDGGDRE